MKRYPLLDILRLVCACLVVMIHVGTDESSPIASMIVSCFSRQAVPFFFIVSGFFFSQKLEKAENRRDFVCSYAKRMLLFYILWTVISLPDLLKDYMELYQDNSWMYIAIVLVRRIVFAGAGQFWYLLVLAETALVAGFLLMHGRHRWLYILAAAGICMHILYRAEPPGMLFGLYHRMMYTVFSWTNNFLMTGIPFFAVGVYFSRNRSRMAVPFDRVCILYFLVSAAAVLCYCVIMKKMAEPDPERFLYFFIPQAVLLFLIGVNGTKISLCPYLCELFRSCSSGLFCLHGIIIEHVLGGVIPWSEYYAVNCVVVIAGCLMLFTCIRLLKIKSLYSLVTLK